MYIMYGPCWLLGRGYLYIHTCIRVYVGMRCDSQRKATTMRPKASTLEFKKVRREREFESRTQAGGPREPRTRAEETLARSKKYGPSSHEQTNS